MSERPISPCPVPPGPDGVRPLLDGLAAALAGGPALAPIPTPTPGLPPAYVAAQVAAVAPAEPLEDERTAVILATSGSTGSPRGVCLSAAAIRASVAAVAALYPALHDVPWVLALPPTSAGGFAVIARALLADVEVHTLPSVGGASPFQAADLAADDLVAQRPAVSLVPAQLARVLDDPRTAAGLAHYRLVLLGGAAAPPDLIGRARDAGITVVTTYGMTETMGGCVHDGAPLDGVRVQIDAGRIVVRGPMVALGYRLEPALTQAAFPEPGCFVTSDVGEWAAGHLRVLGRADDVIVLARGVKVSARAVEEAMRGDHRVREAAIVAVDDPAAGPTLIAAVVLTSADGDDASAIRADLQGRVAALLGPAAAPRTIRFVADLPMLPNGKIDRAAVGLGPT